MKTVAILLAAGSGKRMQSEVSKQYILLEGKPLLFYSLRVLEDSFIDEIVLVVGKDEKEYCRKEIIDRYGFQKVSHIVEGGKERYHSVYHGLQAIQDADYYFIHDSARPMLTADILQRGLVCVQQHKACVIGMPVKDTIKIADQQGFIEYTPNRSQVWAIQTPQIFEGKLIRDAYSQLIKEEADMLQRGIQITDDAMVVETLTGKKVRLVEGSYENVKVTTPEDIGIIESFLQKKL